LRIFLPAVFLPYVFLSGAGARIRVDSREFAVKKGKGLTANGPAVALGASAFATAMADKLTGRRKETRME
jgi:hypothetical protein